LRAPDFIRQRAKRLRRTTTQPERALWALLRRRGWHFRRQHPIGPYILDFYCAAVKLAVEVDGPVHQEQTDRDQRRTAWLETEGIQVIRFSTQEIEQRPAAVLAAIATASPD
jgi:very-short-patch-repair endonuclease